MKSSIFMNLAGMVAAILLTACGGGGGNSDPSTSAESSDSGFVQVAGAGIKGPLAFADVKIFAFDPLFPGFYDKNSPIASGLTDQYAMFSGLAVPTTIEPPYILTIGGANAIDLNTGKAPVISTLITVITEDMLATGQLVYTTPLTTLAFHMAGHGTGQSADANTFTQKLKDASNQAGDMFAISQDTAIDIMSSPLVINDTTVTLSEQQEAVHHRAAIEAFAAKVYELSLSLENTTTDILIEDLADDLQSDGVIDNSADGETIGSIDPAIMNQDPMNMSIPNTSYRVEDIMVLMEEERVLIGSDKGPVFLVEDIDLDNQQPPPGGVSISANDYLGHNQEHIGSAGRQDWGGNTDAKHIFDQVALGKDMVVDFLPEKTGCGYVDCTPGEESLELYLDEITTVGRSEIHEVSLLTALDDLSGVLGSVWLQAGNEVYSKDRRERWEGYFGAMSNQEWIANYVEYFWAPFAAIVTDYEAQHGVDVKLMLGSVQNVSGSENRQMLLDTWNYVIQGWAAPELAGMRVGELYECASGHYLLSNDSDYLTDLGDVFEQTGCFWATEEIGRARSDAGIAYDEMNKVIGRTLHTAIELGLTPEQFRVLPWETNDDAAQASIDFEGASQGAAIIGINGDGETFQVFLSDGRVIDL